MDLTHKYTAICEDTGEEITGYLVVAEGNINKGMAYICPETSIVEFKGTPEENVPTVALGPFYRVIADTVAPAEKATDDAAMLKRYKATGMKPAQIEDFVHVFNNFGIDLPHSSPREADEFLQEFAKYRKSGLSGEAVNKIADVLREHNILFTRLAKDPATVIEEWLERMRWHVKKVDELAEENKRLSGLAEANLQLEKENQRLKCEVAGYRFSKTESLKKQILQFMDASYTRDVESYRSHSAAMDLVAHKLSLEQAIMAVFQDCALNLSQCEDLLSVKRSLLDRIQSMLYRNLPKGKKPIFSESDISDAIYAVAHEIEGSRCARKV